LLYLIPITLLTQVSGFMPNNSSRLQGPVMSKRNETTDEEILGMLAGGALITQVCRELSISPSTLSKWRREDNEFDDTCWSAEGQGIMVQRALLIERMHEAIEASGPGSAIRIQGLHNLLHENGRTAGKLVARMNDRVHVEANVQHMTISWQSEDDTAPDPTLINDGSDYIDVTHSEPILSE